MTAEDALGRLREWTDRYGAELCPGPGRADTYGEGVRASKDQVRRLLRPLDAAVEPLRVIEQAARNVARGDILGMTAAEYDEWECQVDTLRDALGVRAP